MIYTDLAPSSPLWRGRPRHSRPRTYPSSSTRVLSVGTSPSRLSLLVSPSPLLPPCSLSAVSLFFATLARDLRARPTVPQPPSCVSATFVVLAARIRRPWPGCGTSSRKEAFYMDRSQTLTVWAFLATEGGANKVKRGLKNVTLSVECGPLTVNAPLSQAPRPHDARFRSPPLSPCFSLARSLLAPRI